MGSPTQCGRGAYFAEGATIPPFDCQFALANPTATDAAVTLRFLRIDGQVFTRVLSVPAMGRAHPRCEDRRRSRVSGVLYGRRIRRPRRCGPHHDVGPRPQCRSRGDEHRGAFHDLVPGRRRDALELRPLLHDPEPQRVGGQPERALPATRRSAAARQAVPGGRQPSLQHLGGPASSSRTGRATWHSRPPTCRRASRATCR